MKIKLTNVNTDKGVKKVELIFIPREKEVIIATSDGTEIAHINICMMNNCPKSGEKTINTNNFWLQFWPVISELDKNIADVYVEKVEE